MTDVIVHRQRFDNGLELIFYDLTNRYYGDFHQIRIDVLSRMNLTDALLSASGLSEREQLQAKNRFGGLLETHRELKRMGVAGGDVATVIKQMIQQFLDTSLPYMSTSEFPTRMLQQSLSVRSAPKSFYG